MSRHRLPKEIWERVMRRIDSVEDMCQLANVNNSVYKAVGKDFKKLCFHNCIYRLPGETWSTAFSQAVDRVWIRNDEEDIRWCKEGGMVAFLLGRRVLILNLDFSTPFARWITLDNTPMHAAFANKGRYFCVKMNGDVQIITYSVRSAKIIHKQAVDYVCYNRDDIIGFSGRHPCHIFDTNTLRSLLVECGFNRFSPYKTGHQHPYLVTKKFHPTNHKICRLEAINLIQGTRYTFPNCTPNTTSLDLISTVGCLIASDKGKEEFYDVNTGNLLLTSKKTRNWMHLTRSVLFSADTNEKAMIIVNEDTQEFKLCSISLNDLLMKDGIIYRKDWEMSCGLEEVFFVRDMKSLTNRHIAHMVFIDSSTGIPKTRWFKYRPRSKKVLRIRESDSSANYSIPLEITIGGIRKTKWPKYQLQSSRHVLDTVFRLYAREKLITDEVRRNVFYPKTERPPPKITDTLFHSRNALRSVMDTY